MSLIILSQVMLPAIETELITAVDRVGGKGLEELHLMLAYHLGWNGEGAGPKATGKRIRPLLLLLTTNCVIESWETALPAAAAVELIHNFSLIHDDIQDNSPLRRGRETVWLKWGIPQAINAGDAMFTVAYLALLRLSDTMTTEITLRATKLLHKTCLNLTQGQYLDIAYESQKEIALEAYWPMIEGKTAALIAACTEIGALIGGAAESRYLAYREFGRSLGLAFQAKDDLLGIWGDAATTGKSAESDLLTGKKSLPVLYGLSLNGPFADRWRRGNIQADEVQPLAKQLESEGARHYTQQISEQYTQEALQALEQAQPQGAAKIALIELVNTLLTREV